MMHTANVNYLRVSVTDRCNLRCAYCNPLSVEGLTDRTAILTLNEIHRIVSLCAAMGVTRVRLTGGEPLVRDGIVDLVRNLAAIPEITDLSLTTNGVLLGAFAVPLRAAGLQRVNISLDAAEGACFARITGHDRLEQVMDGVYKAIGVGLAPVRINCVVLRNVNLDQVPALARMSLCLPVAVRFIEYCPPGMTAERESWYISNDEVRDLVESHLGPLSPVTPTHTGGPATYFQPSGAAGMVGFISGRSSRFCQHCRRLRLTCDGRLRPCLHCARDYDLKNLLEGSDDTLLDAIARALRDKHRYTKADRTWEAFSMQHVGG